MSLLLSDLYFNVFSDNISNLWVGEHYKNMQLGSWGALNTPIEMYLLSYIFARVLSNSFICIIHVRVGSKNKNI